MRPSLSLNFRAMNELDPRLAFTRADTTTCATYIGSDGYIKTAAPNEPRFTHDPLTKKKLGLLIEQTRTNLLLQSEDFSAVNWLFARSGVSSAPTIIAPDGSTNTTKLHVDAISPNTQRYIYQPYSVNIGLYYTMSIYAKAAEKSWIAIITSTSGGAFLSESVYFNLSDGTIYNPSGHIASITPAGGGWYRCVLCSRCYATYSNARTIFAIAEGAGDSTLAEADGSTGIYVWGAQSEEEITGAIHFGTAQTGTANTITLTAGASATTSIFVDCRIFITGGTGAGQTSIISAYNGTTKVATVEDAWGVIPDNTSTYSIYRAVSESTVTSYIKTTTTAVTRASDLVSLPAAELSKVYNDANRQGTLICSWSGVGSNYNGSRVSTIASPAGFISDQANYIFIFKEKYNEQYIGSDDTIRGGTVVGATQANQRTTPTNYMRCGLSFKKDRIYFANAGVSSSGDTLANIPSVTTLHIGNWNANRYFINGYMAELDLYPEAVDREELKILTEPGDKHYPDFTYHTASKKLDSRFTFTRPDATTCASYFDQSGMLRYALPNEPRFDYNPITLAFRGLLLEGARSNGATFSEDFNNSAWARANIITTGWINAAVAPDGAMTAEKIIPNTSNIQHAINRVFSVSSSFPVSYSVFVKPDGYNFCQLKVLTGAFSDVTPRNVEFDLSAGTATSLGGSLNNFGIQPLLNGWFRIWITITPTLSNSVNFQIIVYETSGNDVFVGDGISGVSVWGAQYETDGYSAVNYFPSSYIPTGASSVARSGDSLYQDSNLSAWNDYHTGTFISTISTFSVPSPDNMWPKVFSLGEIAGSDRVELYFNELNSNLLVFGTNTAGVSGWSNDTVFNPSLDVKMKIGFSYSQVDEVGSAYIAVNGKMIDDTITITEWPDNEKFFLGGTFGHLESVTYHREAKVGDELRRMTEFNKVESNRPALMCNFADSKKLDSRFAFARGDVIADSATYFNGACKMVTAASNEPRFDHHKVTGECLGILLEPTSTNVFRNDFQTVNQGSIVTGTAIDPMGNAAKAFIPTSGAVSFPNVGSSTVDKIDISLTEGQSTFVSVSGYFKNYGPSDYRPLIAVVASVSGASQVYATVLFDANSGGFTYNFLNAEFTEVSPPTATLTACGMWYVTWSLKFTQSSTIRNMIGYVVQCRLSDNNGTYTADGVSGFQLFGIQLEQRSSATSYIVTTNAQAVRALEKLQMPSENFSRIYNQEEGTFVISGDMKVPSEALSDEVPFSIGDNTLLVGVAESIYLFKDNLSSQISMRILDDGAFTANLASSSFVPLNDTKFTASIAYKLNDVAYSLNGKTPLIDTSAAMPAPPLPSLHLGGGTVGWASSAPMTGHISRLIYFTKRLSNDEMQRLASYK